MIPVYRPQIHASDVAAVTAALREGSISGSGEPVRGFEAAWASACGRRFGVAVNSGTSALQLALAVCGLGPGDEVIVPSYSIMSCALAVIHNGLRPVFVDCDPDTLCIDVDKAEEVVGPETRAVIVVDTYGHPADMSAVMGFARAYELVVIEDAAEAHGSLCFEGDTWRACGSFGQLSTFSFYANKVITTGEGGMVLTDDPLLAKKAAHLRNLAFGDESRFVHQELGFSFRMSSMQAALGCSQIAQLEAKVAQKRDLAKRYSKRLSDIPGLQLPIERDWARSVHWMYWIILEEGLVENATSLRSRLFRRGIETRPFFVGLHQQPILQELGITSPGNFKITERISRAGVILPSSSDLTDDELDFIVEAIREELTDVGV